MSTPKEQALAAELDALRLENKRLARKASMMQSIIDRSRASAAAKSSLSASIMAEKSRQERFMALLLENCPEIMLLFDWSRRFAYCTRSFLTRMRLRSFGLIYGRTYHDVFAHFADDDWIARFDAAYHAVVTTKEIQCISEDADMGLSGNVRTYSIHLAPMLDNTGQVEGVLALFHDQTDVTRAKEAAIDANNAKSDLFEAISRKIYRPVLAVDDCCGRLADTALTPEQADSVAGIRGAVETLLPLVTKVIDFSQLDAGKLTLEADYFDLVAALSSLRDRYALRFRRKGIAFTCSFAPTLPAVAFGDRERILRILVSLLDNALQHTQAGHVTLRAAPQGSGEIVIAVEDTGSGIREEDIPFLFLPYEQLSAAAVSSSSFGEGLGLPVAYLLCQLMGGTIDVHSAFGKGSVFTVRLPLPAGPATESAAQALPTLAAPDARVLVVDDIDANLLVADSMLGSFAVTCQSAHSGAQALEMLAKEAFDLVLMDCAMPDMDGMEATQRLRQSPGPNSGVPVIALHADAQAERRSILLACGFNDVLSKPIDRAAMVECLLRWLPPEKVRQEPS